MSAFPQNIPLCFSPHIVSSQQAISLCCHGEISAAVLIYIPLSVSWKGNHLPVEKKKTSLLFPWYNLSPPSFPALRTHTPPRCRLFAFIAGRGNGCVRARVRLKLDAWKLLLLCELNSRWAGVWVCVYICRVKGLPGPGVCFSVRALTCWFSIPMASRLCRSLVCMSSILLRFRATHPCVSILQHKRTHKQTYVTNDLWRLYGKSEQLHWFKKT